MIMIHIQVISPYVWFSHFRINGEVSSNSSKFETEPVSKPKLDSEQLPLRPKSVDLDSFTVRSSKETGKLTCRKVVHLKKSCQSSFQKLFKKFVYVFYVWIDRVEIN